MIKPRLAGDTIRQISDGGPWKMVIGQARFADLVPCITTGHTDVDVIPPSHTRFWECEYCGTVNPIDTLDCRAKACGHSITKKAMEAAWEGPKTPQDKIDEAKAHTPKMQVYGPGAEDAVIDALSRAVLVGSGSAGASSWTVSGKGITFRGGTAVQAYIGTDGTIHTGA
jgi:hypothetical protein